MVPAALRRELLQVDPDAVVRRGRLDEPRALRVHRVVAHRVGKPALGRVEPEKVNIIRGV